MVSSFAELPEQCCKWNSRGASCQGVLYERWTHQKRHSLTDSRCKFKPLFSVKYLKYHLNSQMFRINMFVNFDFHVNEFTMVVLAVVRRVFCVRPLQSCPKVWSVENVLLPLKLQRKTSDDSYAGQWSSWWVIFIFQWNYCLSKNII